jgi:hypothetical protein
MPTFRIRDLIVAVGLGRRAAAPEQPNAPQRDDRTRTDGTGCIAGTYALYACLKGPSVHVDCGDSTTWRLVTPPPCGWSYGDNTTWRVPAPAVCAFTCPDTTTWRAVGPPPEITLIRTHPAPVPIDCMSVDELERLKCQLAEVLKKVDQREEQLRREADGAAKQPETLGEVEDLERRLKDALDELRKKRDELQRAGKSTDKPTE